MCRFAVLRRQHGCVGCLLYPTVRLQNGRAVLRLRIHRSGGCDGVLRHISVRRNIGYSALSHLHSADCLLSAIGEILVSRNKGKTRCGCTRRAAQSGLQDERRLALLRLGRLRLSHTLVYGFPKSVGSIGLEFRFIVERNYWFCIVLSFLRASPSPCAAAMPTCSPLCRAARLSPYDSCRLRRRG